MCDLVGYAGRGTDLVHRDLLDRLVAEMDGRIAELPARQDKLTVFTPDRPLVVVVPDERAGNRGAGLDHSIGPDSATRSDVVAAEEVTCFTQMMKIADVSRKVVVVLTAVTMSLTLVGGSANAAPGMFTPAGSIMSSSSVKSSTLEERNWEIALQYIDYSGPIPVFERNAAIAAGVDERWANDFAVTFEEYAPKIAELRKGDSSLTPGQQFGPGVSWGCILAVAGAAGVTASAIAAIFASGGTLAFILAQYGIAGAAVAEACY